MRSLKFLVAVLGLSFFMAACQKEFSVELGLSEGTLKQDGLGVCLPSTVNGIFKEDTLLNNTNYIEVQLNVTETGTYIISSDTINGYYFSGGGTLDALGINSVRLYAHGRPTDPGINTFTIQYDSSSCLIDIPVVAIGPPATYTLGGAGGACTGVSPNGVYMVSVPMVPNNTVTIDVDVTVTGSYSITTPVVNGLSFSASGDFITTGPQTVTLNAIGTPAAAGDFVFPVAASTSNCSFTLTVTAAGGPAVYTLGGAGAACTGVVLAGTYQQGAALTAANTATINVNVTTIGAYTISTTLANGVTFSKIGIFTATGAQTVTLTGSGVPTTSGATTHTVNGAVGTCTFAVTYTAGASPAVFTLSGAPNACTVATVAGTYTAGTALTAANTVTVQVNVTTIGAYSISTTTVNGMTFSKTGTFAATGNQNVVLNGTGTPAAAGASNFSFTGGSSCTFTVNVTGGTTNILSATISGLGAMNFVDGAMGYYYTDFTDFAVEGWVSQASATVNNLWFNIDKETQGPGTNVTPGTYTNTGQAPGVYDFWFEFIDANGDLWLPGPADPFTITITSLTNGSGAGARAVGTFSGTVRDDATGTQTKTITNGVFNLPIP